MYKYSDRYRIRANETDSKGQAKADALLVLLQETAGNHADLLNFDIQTLNKEDRTWVLRSLHLKIYQYPVWKDEIRIVTWPSKAGHYKAFRDFQIFDSRKKILGEAVTEWIIVDLVKRRPVKIPLDIENICNEINKTLFESSLKTLNNQISGTETISTFRVRYSDLDINEHVNNTVYLRWMLDTLIPEISENKKCSELKISYKAEALPGQQIDSLAVQNGTGLCYHKISPSNDKKILSEAITKWS